MGDANPIRTLGDYSKPSHEGYRNTIELPEWEQCGTSSIRHHSVGAKWMLIPRTSLAIGLNVFQKDPSPHERILLVISLLNSFHRKDRKTPQRYPYVPTTSRRISLRSMDSFQGLTPKSPSSCHRSLASDSNFL
ncbi:hypothetical protein Tco_1455577 [Tanacetum coccineum]